MLSPIACKDSLFVRLVKTFSNKKLINKSYWFINKHLRIESLLNSRTFFIFFLAIFSPLSKFIDLILLSANNKIFLKTKVKNLNILINSYLLIHYSMYTNLVLLFYD